MRRISPCPFCGAKARLTTEKDVFHDLLKRNGGACVTIECIARHECGTTMFCHFKSNNYEEMVEEATNRWNRRTFNA